MSYDLNDVLLERKALLIEYRKAELVILKNQEYTIKDRTFVKANLSEIRKAIKDLERDIQRITDGGMNVRLGIPREF